MKAFSITARTLTGVHRWTAIAASLPEALGAACEQFTGQPVQITIQGARK